MATTDWSWLAPLITGVGNIATSGLDMNTAREAAGMADPFSGERQQYQTGLRNFMGANPVNPGQVTAGTNNALASLMSLLSNPSSIALTPEYRAGLGFGTEALNRGAGASGLLNSGNRLAGLDKFGQDYGMNFLHQILSDRAMGVNENIAAANLGLNAQQQGYGQLANLAGVNAGSPVAAGQMLLGGRQTQANSVGAGIGGIANGIGGALGAFQRILGGGGMNLGGGGNLLGPGQIMGPPDNLFGDTSGIYGPPSDLFGPGFDLGGGTVLPDTSLSDLFNAGDIFGGL